MDIFFETVLEDIVKLEPSKCNKNFKKNIKNLLVSKYEGICSKFGYIKNDSIEILTNYVGKVELQTFHGYVNFNVKFKASICNPAVGSVFKCTIKNLNSFGILANVYLSSGELLMNIIIPKQSATISNSSHIDSVKINDEVFVELIGKKYQLNSKTISAIAKLIDSSDSRINMEDMESKLKIDDNDDYDNNDDDNDDASILSETENDEKDDNSVTTDKTEQNIDDDGVEVLSDTGYSSSGDDPYASD
jgi:DNA-directed RNA polymerase subunit E'/Rpb7|tara:strand:- start:18400 stop:19140 length:741 start_codon:yes stop_codon:yes gene_type:complete